MESSEEGHVIVAADADLAEVTAALEASLGEPDTAKLVWRPQTSTPLDEDTARTVLKLVEALEDDDDVQTVVANFEVSDEVMQRLAS